LGLAHDRRAKEDDVRKVVHFEIPADDLDRAKAFYGGVFGWQISSFDMPDGSTYTGASTVAVDETMTPTEPGAINGALVQRDASNPAPVVTIDVDDITAALAEVAAAGGSTVMPRTAIPGMGAFGYFTDPEGNVVGLWETE
jgi:predicted enzyme related to lactoylglutathione lyase